MKKCNKIEDYLNKLKLEIEEYDYYRIERKVAMNLLSMSIMDTKLIKEEDLILFRIMNNDTDFNVDVSKTFIAYNSDGKLFFTDRQRNRAILKRDEFMGLIEHITGLINYT